jgi:hypothetical protein
VGATATGEGVTVKVHFTKRDGAPVHFIPADDPRETAAVREIDLQNKYYLSRRDLSERLGLTQPRTTALRRYLGIDEDDSCHHVFQFDSQTHHRYSDNALREMQTVLDAEDMDEIWAQHRPRRTRPA